MKCRYIFSGFLGGVMFDRDSSPTALNDCSGLKEILRAMPSE